MVRSVIRRSGESESVNKQERLPKKGCKSTFLKINDYFSYNFIFNYYLSQLFALIVYFVLCSSIHYTHTYNTLLFLKALLNTQNIFVVNYMYPHCTYDVCFSTFDNPAGIWFHTCRIIKIVLYLDQNSVVINNVLFFLFLITPINISTNYQWTFYQS